MRYLKISGLVLLVAVFLIAGCENLPFFAPKKKPSRPPQTTQEPMMEVSGTVIARVNNMPITLEELNEQVDEINKMADEQKRPDSKINTRDKKIAFLKDALIKQKLLYQEALRRGIDKKDSIRKALSNVRVELLREELLKEELDKIDVTSSEIQEFYNTYKDNLREPEERNIREIVVSTETDAKQVLSRYYSGEDFAALARQYSKSDTASAGGDLGFITLPRTEQDVNRCDKFYEAAFSPSIEAGNVSSIFRCTDGWYIIKLESKKEGKLPTINELWDRIKERIKYDKTIKQMESFINRLTSEANIVIEENKIY